MSSIIREIRGKPLYKIHTSLFGRQIDIACNDKALYSALVGFIDPIAVSYDNKPKIKIKLSVIKDRQWRPPVLGNKQLPVFGAPGISCFRDRARGYYFYTDLKGYLAILKSKSRIECLVIESLLSVPGFIRYSIVIPLLSEIFKFNCLYKLHAAALENNRKGFLFVGPSGSGKTTLTLALIKRGYKFISDDLVFIEHPAPAVEAASIIDDSFRVRKKHGDSTVLRVLDPAVICPRRRINRVNISSVIFPKITDKAKTKIVPIDQGEAFRLLLKSDSLIAYGPAYIIRKHVSCLRGIASLPGRYIISLGKDALIEPEIVPKILDSLENSKVD